MARQKIVFFEVRSANSPLFERFCTLQREFLQQEWARLTKRDVEYMAARVLDYGSSRLELVSVGGRPAGIALSHSLEELFEGGTQISEGMWELETVYEDAIASFYYGASVFVRQSYRERGLGQQLVDRMIQAGRQRGYLYHSYLTNQAQVVAMNQAQLGPPVFQSIPQLDGCVMYAHRL